MKKIISAIILLLSLSLQGRSEEGMWIPVLLGQLNMPQMQSMGFRLTAEDIYSLNHSSMKDAIVQFGGGCTAEIVSPEGLILTNHHCGLGAVQRHSSVEHDYLANGFWAMSRKEELPNPGLTVTMLVRMEDVTGKILKGVTDSMTQAERARVIRENSAAVEQEAVKGTKYEAKVRPFYYGNQYYLLVTQVFKDIRLVGAPPQAIGQFGGDTDNWMWPRHGGDFSVFRIYVDKNNQPAEYCEDNVPYKPAYYFPVSVKGYQQGDFTFVFGYPGTTREYLTSYGVDLVANTENPTRIRLRQERLDIMNKAMESSTLVRIQYTSKHAGIANGWKKMIGESKGISRLDAVEKKRESEKAFQAWAENRQGTGLSYGLLLPAFQETYQQLIPLDMAAVYLNEGGMGIEVVRFASGFRDLVKISKKKDTKNEDIDKAVAGLQKSAAAFYKDYQPAVDLEVMTVMLGEMSANLDSASIPDEVARIREKYGKDFNGYSTWVFSNSVFADSAKCFALLDNYRASGYKHIEKDPVFILASSIYGTYENVVFPGTTKLTGRIDSLQRIYMAGQLEMQPGKRFYPDANSTLRVSYGKVDNYRPADGVTYNYFTTAAGILQKEDSTIYDYAVDNRLKDMIAKGDYGRYADRDGSLHIAFIASNHTTGGNSGSPVLNAEGELIGINFDRNWEGTMSDLMYDPAMCRNITLDIRYCLFIMDKYAGAKHLVDEMTINE
jgi:hypothetical protein